MVIRAVPLKKSDFEFHFFGVLEEATIIAGGEEIKRVRKRDGER